MKKEYNEELIQFRLIKSIFIIEPDGTPLLLINYRKENDLSDTSNETLMAGFFTAIKLFSENTLQKDIRNITMGDSLYYFVSDGSVLLIIETSSEISVTTTQKELIEELINQLILNIQSTFDLYDKFKENINLDEIKTTIDSLVYETEIEVNSIVFGNTVNNFKLEEKYAENYEEGKSIDNIESSSFWSRIKNVFSKKDKNP